MFKAIVHFSIQKKLFVGLTTLFLLLGGIYAMMTLPIDAGYNEQSSANRDGIANLGPARGRAIDHHAYRDSDE